LCMTISCRTSQLASEKKCLFTPAIFQPKADDMEYFEN
jgi:hypothetical protein